MGLILARSFTQSGLRHALSQAAFGNEGLLQRSDLLVQQIVGLVNHTDNDVRHHLGGTRFEICPIGRIGAGAESADVDRFFGVFLPQPQVAGSQVVAEVFQQFLQAGARATLVSLISVSLDVPEAMQPSTIFCLPERAACTI